MCGWSSSCINSISASCADSKIDKWDIVIKVRHLNINKDGYSTMLLIHSIDILPRQITETPFRRSRSREIASQRLFDPCANWRPETPLRIRLCRSPHQYAICRGMYANSSIKHKENVQPESCDDLRINFVRDWSQVQNPARQREL
jgi:hypothetical protein